MPDAEFQPIRPFDIDDGQLDGLSPQECFVLGYELAEIDRLLSGDAPFERPAHSSNRERIEKACRKSRRSWSLSYMQDDQSESWMWLRVGATDDLNQFLDA